MAFCTNCFKLNLAVTIIKCLTPPLSYYHLLFLIKLSFYYILNGCFFVHFLALKKKKKSHFTDALSITRFSTSLDT